MVTVMEHAVLTKQQLDDIRAAIAISDGRLRPDQRDRLRHLLGRAIVLEMHEREILGTKFSDAIANIVSHCKRSLLDYLDAIGGRSDERVRGLCGQFYKRVHNDVSVVEHQVEACFQILKSGGIIPPFGRNESRAARLAEESNGSRHAAHG